jgi:hypothetical protein
MAIANGKYKGKSLSLTIDSVEYNMDVTSVVLDNEEADNDATTFADLASGGARQWFIEAEAISDYGTGSLWSYVWDNAGTDGVAFVIKPYENATPTATQPHFTGTLKVGPKPGGIGGTAGETFTFEVRFDVIGEPEKVIA